MPNNSRLINRLIRQLRHTEAEISLLVVKGYGRYSTVATKADNDRYLEVLCDQRDLLTEALRGLGNLPGRQSD